MKMGSVTLSEAAQKSLVADITEAVIKKTSEETLEQLRAAVRLEADLTRTREELARSQAEVQSLREYINRLTSFLTPSTPAVYQPSMTALTGTIPPPPVIHQFQVGPVTQPPADPIVSANGHATVPGQTRGE